MTERIEQGMGTGKVGSILVQMGTNNADREGTTAIVKTYRTLPQANEASESWAGHFDQQTSAAAM